MPVVSVISDYLAGRATVATCLKLNIGGPTLQSVDTLCCGATGLALDTEDAPQVLIAAVLRGQSCQPALQRALAKCDTDS